MNIKQVIPDELIQYPDGTLAEVYNKGKINEYIRHIEKQKDVFKPVQQLTREEKPIIVLKDRQEPFLLNQKLPIKRQKSRKQSRGR
jgi:hypothetical protein